MLAINETTIKTIERLARIAGRWDADYRMNTHPSKRWGIGFDPCGEFLRDEINSFMPEIVRPIYRKYDRAKRAILEG